jgi:hypothetical protein
MARLRLHPDRPLAAPTCRCGQRPRPSWPRQQQKCGPDRAVWAHLNAAPPDRPKAEAARWATVWGPQAARSSSKSGRSGSWSTESAGGPSSASNNNSPVSLTSHGNTSSGGPLTEPVLVDAPAVRWPGSPRVCSSVGNFRCTTVLVCAPLVRPFLITAGCWISATRLRLPPHSQTSNVLVGAPLVRRHLPARFHRRCP